MIEEDKKMYCFNTAKEFVNLGLIKFEDIYTESDKIYAYVFGTKEP